MSMMQIVQLVILGLHSFLSLVSAAEDIDYKSLSVDELHDLIPAPLTLAQFDKALEKGYHVVEFYSPYCPHCQHLLPHWVEFYHQSKENHPDAFTIHQVDCVVSGDLCDRESIKYYPNIRFYGPNSKLLGSMTTANRNAETLSEFAHDQLLAWTEEETEIQLATNNANNANLELSNHMLEFTELLSLMNGENDTPTVVSFWPTLDDQLNDLNFQAEYKENAIFKHFDHLYYFRNLWNLVVKRSQIRNGSKIDFKYFNCRSNKEICSNLGFDNLNKLSSSIENYPKIILYLPNSTQGLKSINYNFEITEENSINFNVKSIMDWIQKNMVNSDTQPKPFDDIRNFINAKTNLNNIHSLSEYSDYSKIAFIQVNAPGSRYPEDDLLLQHLTQKVADIPSNIYLFQTNDDEKVMSFLKEQEKNMIEKYLLEGRDPKEELEDEDYYRFNETIFANRIDSLYPMFICIKEGSIYSHVLPNFLSKEMRDFTRVSDFIKQNSLPIVNHLTSENVDIIIPDTFNDILHDKSEKVLISITDFQAKNLFQTDYFSSYIYHRNQHTLNRNEFKRIEYLRSLPYEELSERDKIEHFYNSPANRIYPVYTDTKELSKIIGLKNWNNLNANLKPGDSILVSRFKNEFWVQDLHHKPLTTDKTTPVLELLKEISNSNKWYYFWNNNHSQKLTNPNFFLQLLTYLAALLLILRCFKLFRSWYSTRKATHDRLRGLGILGISSSGTSEPSGSKYD